MRISVNLLNVHEPTFMDALVATSEKCIKLRLIFAIMMNTF